ncbi:MAG TPA: ABC transporter permease [Acidimicrobiales bacterium]|nr:ABC transporter permease [Acidimicrobiales bacterium]
MTDSAVAVEPGFAGAFDQPIRAGDIHGWRLVVRRFRRQRLAMVCLVFALLISLAGVLAPWIAPYDLGESTSKFMTGPSRDHLLGTDQAGYDTLSRVLFATRTSMYAALLAVALAVAGGTLIGLVSGYFGRWVDTVLMRIIDAIMAYPGLLMAMAVVGALGPGITNAMIGLSVAFMPGFARLVRGQVLAVREEAYVEAARVVGASGPRIIRRHIVPNILSALIVQAFMAIGFALLAEGALAFIGLSVQPPDTSLGSLMQRGFTLINVTLRLALIPGLVITVLSFSFNAIADGLRDALARHEFSPEIVM